MDDFFDGLGPVSAQDDFDLAALRYFEELDQQGGKHAPPAPEPPAPEPSSPEELPLIPEDIDGLTLRLMADLQPSANQPPAAKPKRPLTRPVPTRKTAGRSAPSSAELSDLALDAARLFQSLPTEDQLLAYTLLQKLAKAGEPQKGTR